MSTKRHNGTRTLAAATLIALAGVATTALAEFRVSGNGPYVNDHNMLVFDGEEEVDAYVICCCCGPTLKDLLPPGDIDKFVIDIALETAANNLNFRSLAAQLAEYQSGTVDEGDLNVDAHLVVGCVQKRLLNPDLEIQFGASIYKVMGDSVVEITDGDATTLEWLRHIQRERGRIAIETNLDDPDVRWLADSAHNLRVHIWRRQTNCPDYEGGPGGLPRFFSRP